MPMLAICPVLGWFPLGLAPRPLLRVKLCSRILSAACVALRGVHLSCNDALRTPRHSDLGSVCVGMRWS